MRQITKISVWKKNSEVRIYVSFWGESKQGVYFKTGNNYNPKGTLVDISNEEKIEALKISSKFHGQNIWGDVYENQINTTLTKKEKINNSDFDLKAMNSDMRKGYIINACDYLNM